MNCVHMSECEIKISGCYEGLVPVFTSRRHGALIHPTPPPCRCVVSSHRGCCVAARASAASVPVPACLQIPLRPSWPPSSAIRLCQICTPASANHSLASESTPRTHHRCDPSPGLQGAALPLLIVLKTECYQDLISPGLPLARGTNVHSV